MNADFDRAMEFVLKWEGFISDHPDDPGKLTIFGIAGKYHPEEVRQMKTLIDGNAKEAALNIAKKIYWREYWEAAGCDALEWPMNLVVFDCAVNQGVKRAVGFRDSALNWTDVLFKRLTHYLSLGKPMFIAGWVNRIIDLYETAKTAHPISEEYRG